MLIERVNNLFTQIIPLIHILLQHILQTLVEGHRFGEVVVGIGIENGNHKDAFAVLRNPVIFGIEHLIVTVIP